MERWNVQNEHLPGLCLFVCEEYIESVLPPFLVIINITLSVFNLVLIIINLIKLTTKVLNPEALLIM